MSLRLAQRYDAFQNRKIDKIWNKIIRKIRKIWDEIVKQRKGTETKSKKLRIIFFAEERIRLKQRHSVVPVWNWNETYRVCRWSARHAAYCRGWGVQRKLCINCRILRTTVTLECIYSRMTVRRNCIDALTWILAALSSRVLFINHAASPFPYLRSRLHVKSIHPIISFRRNYVSLPARYATPYSSCIYTHAQKSWGVSYLKIGGRKSSLFPCPYFIDFNVF